MGLWKRFITLGLAAGALGLSGALVGCTLSAHVYDPGGPPPIYYDNYVYTPAPRPGYYRPYYYYTDPGLGIYYYDGRGHRHYGRYHEQEARQWHEQHRR